MTLNDALHVIENHERGKGFAVNFEEIGIGVLKSNHFPEVHPAFGNEDGFKTEEQAWTMARRYADATKGKTCNFYVIYASDFTPVPGYKERMINKR